MPTLTFEAQAVLGDLAAGHPEIEQDSAADTARRRAGGRRWFGCVAEHRVEDLGRHRHEVGVRDPRAVEPVARLALLVLAHLGERDRVHLGIAVATG